MRIVAYSYTDPLLESNSVSPVWEQPIAHHYIDRGDRTQLAQLLTDCQADPPDMILVRHLSELGDSPQAVSDRLAQLDSLGIPLLALEDPLGRPDSPLTRADLLRLLQALQDTHRSRRLRQGHARNRLKALPPPGKAPYGYRRGKDRYVLDRTAAAIVKDFFEHFLLYGSLRGSVRYLQQKHHKTISVSTGQRWLTSPVYRGDLEYQTGEVVPDTHPAILSRPEAAQIDRLLRRNRAIAPRSASAPRSLAGLVMCANCQSPMTVTRATSRNGEQEYLYLRPTACPKQPTCGAIAYQAVLDRTIARICEDLPRAVSTLTLPNLDSVKQQLTSQMRAKETILDQLPALVKTGILDSETADLRAYKLRTEMAQLQNQVAQLPPVDLKAIAQVASLPEFWRDLSEAERRFYFREFIRRIHLVRHETGWQIELVFIF
ncbi:MAG TPA: recombinase family protein [Synechococcales cyanobacterium M55_K2018_004]|nr:recombinase family protein [Synechococcales cyanobacterium M55_K2018_004]